MLRSEVDALQIRVQRLEYSQPADYLAFKPTEKSWRWLTSQDYPVRMGIHDLAAAGNGSKVSFDIGNPLAMSLGSCTIRLIWFETDSQGNAVTNTRHEDVRKIDGWIPAGGYATPNFSLEDIPPAKLGKVTVSDLLCLQTREEISAR